MKNPTKTKRTRVEKLGMCALYFFTSFGFYSVSDAESYRYLAYWKHDWLIWGTDDVSQTEWDGYQLHINTGCVHICDDYIDRDFNTQKDWEEIGLEMDAAVEKYEEKHGEILWFEWGTNQ